MSVFSYTPQATITVSPATAKFIAALMLENGTGTLKTSPRTPDGTTARMQTTSRHLRMIFPL